MQTARTSLLSRRLKSPVLRAAILTIALWQALVTVAPHPVSFSAASSDKPHFHATGDRLELSHDETACPVCTLQQSARVATEPARLPVAAVTALSCLVAAGPAASQSPSIYNYSRGPPALS